MAKKRKTREGKKLADLRHNFQHQVVLNTFDSKLPLAKIGKQETSTSTYHPYVVKDLTKTFMLTGVIVAAQIVLFFILKNHLITIFGLTY